MYTHLVLSTLLYIVTLLLQGTVPSFLAKSDGELQLDFSEGDWPPQCGESEWDCEYTFCNGLKTYLQAELCEGNEESCDVEVTCDPEEVTRRRLDAPKISNVKSHRALQSVDLTFPFQVSLLIACSTPDCSDTAGQAAAAAAAMAGISSTLDSIASKRL